MAAMAAATGVDLKNESSIKPRLKARAFVEIQLHKGFTKCHANKKKRPAPERRYTLRFNHE